MPPDSTAATLRHSDEEVAMSTLTGARPKVRAKEFAFPLTIRWIGGRRVAAEVAGKQSVEVAPPTVFRGTDPSVWSPEDLLVAAAASCLAVTFTGLAEHDGLTYTALEVDGSGVCGTRSDGRFGFTNLLLRLAIETDPVDEARARALAEKAEKACLVSASLDLPVETVIDIRLVWDRVDRANGEEAWRTLDEREREATTPGTPRLKW
jgi:organic hydroperoxide reductase OsmC/OhrA